MKSSSLAAIAVGVIFASPLAAKPAHPPAEPTISISKLSSDRFELVYSGITFTSRDQVERDLLVHAARLALAHNNQWFVLLAMPGERQDFHPARPNPGFGAKYGHWQPHWNYYVARYGWQWWHPEWGDDFWTKDVDPKTVARFEVHAMIDLGQSAAQGEELQFNAKDVVRDLTRPSDVALQHSTP